MARLGALLEHWPLKLLSLGFAIILWVYVTAEDKVEAAFTVPVSVTGLAPGLAAVGDETVDLRVQGRRNVLARLSERDFRIEVPVDDPRPGERVVRVLPRDVRAPRGVRVVRVAPSSIRVTVAISR